MKHSIIAAALVAIMSGPAAAHVPADCKTEYRAAYAARAVVAHRLERLSHTVFGEAPKLDQQKALASVITGMLDDEEAFNGLMDCIRATN